MDRLVRLWFASRIVARIAFVTHGIDEKEGSVTRAMEVQMAWSYACSLLATAYTRRESCLLLSAARNF